MSNALRIAHGPFGRVALLDMDAPLVRHAHPHCHVLIKAEGADTQFLVRDQIAPLTRESAVLINAWESHSYVHDLQRPRTIILALYIEPVWLGCFRHNWIASNAPGFFHQPGVLLPLRVRRLADELAEGDGCQGRGGAGTAAVRADDRRHRAVCRMAGRALTAGHAARSRPAGTPGKDADPGGPRRGDEHDGIGPGGPDCPAPACSACSSSPPGCRRACSRTCCGWSARWRP